MSHQSHGSGIFTSLSNLREKMIGSKKPVPRSISSIKELSRSTPKPSTTTPSAPSTTALTSAPRRTTDKPKSSPYLSPPLSSFKRSPSAESDFEVQFSARPVSTTQGLNSASGGASGSSDSFSEERNQSGLKLANDPYQR